MNLSYSEEQLALQDAAVRILSRDPTRGNATPSENYGHQLWRQFAELGWTALLVPPQYGGLGGDDVDLSILMETFGRFRTTTPYFATVVLCATLIERAGKATRNAELLTAVAAGQVAISLAYLEPRSGERVVVEDIPGSDGHVRIRGVKTLVLSAPSADQIVVSASRGDRLELYLVSKEMPGMSHVEYTTLANEKAWDITFDDVVLRREARLDEGDASAALAFTLDRAAVAIAFDALGAAEALLAATVAYANNRHQFGKPLTALQTVRHRLADMAVACEEARAINIRGALTVHDDRNRSIGASAAKWKGMACARFVAEQAIQLHGAMGMSEELPAGSYFRRILAAELLFGLPAHHLQRYAALSRESMTRNAWI